MKKQIGSFEINGEVFTDLRITTGDKIKLERTARVRKWDLEENIFSTTAFMVWAAATRLGKTSLGFDAFCEEITDAQIEDPDKDKTEDEDEDVQGLGLTQNSED